MMQSLLGNSRKPDISFYRSGRIDITTKLSKRLGLEAGDVIDILFDGMEFYLYVRAKADTLMGKHEAQCHPTNPECRNCHNFRVYSKRICDRIIRIAGTGSEARIYAGGDVQIQGHDAVIIIPKSAELFRV